MVKWIVRIAAVVALAAALGWGWRTFFPSDERQIRNLLTQVAQTVSVPADAKFVAGVLAADRLKGCFTPELEIDVEVPGVGRHTFSGREELAQAYVAARSQYRGLQVDFLDVVVTLGPNPQGATAELTARVRRGGERDFAVQELRMQLEKREEQWRIHRVATTRSIQR